MAVAIAQLAWNAEIMLHIKDLEAFARINAAIAGHDDEAPKTHEEREHSRIAAAHLFMKLAGATLRRAPSQRPADSVAGQGGEAEAHDLANQLTEAALNTIAAQFAAQEVQQAADGEAAATGEPGADGVVVDPASPHSPHGPLGLMEALSKKR